MKKSLTLFALSLIILFFIVSCSDDVNKMLLSDSQTRIEYSNCTGCYECLEEFDCPENAIFKDPATNELTVYIDTEKCVNCMKCMNIFICPDNAITTSPDRIEPGEITNFNAVSDSAGRLDISFTAPGDDGDCGLVYRYELNLLNDQEEAVAFDFEFPLLLQEAGESEFWQITDLPPNQELTVQLQAFDEAGQASVPAMKNVLIADVYVDIFPPAPITDLVAESQEEMILLSWTASGDDGVQGSSHGYEIRYSENEITDGNWDTAELIEQNIIPAAQGETETFSVSEIPWQIDYYFSLKAYDSEGNYSPVSNNSLANIIGDIIAPAAITDLTVADVAPQSVLLSWTAVGDDELEGIADHYRIKVSETEITNQNWDSLPEFENELIPQPAGLTESINITGLEPLTNYYFAVKSVDEAENMAEISNPVSATTIEIPDTIPPAAVTDLSAEATYTQIILNWTASGDDGNEGTAYQYMLRMSETEITANNFNDAVLLPDPPNPLPAGNQQEYLVNDLEPETDYYFALKVMDAEENISDLSNIAVAALLNDTTAPSVVTDLQAEAIDTSVMLSWTAPGDDNDIGTAAYYDIRMSSEEINESNWQTAIVLANPPQPQTSGLEENYLVEDLSYYQDYYFALKAYDEVENDSGISNLAYALLEEDATAPAAVSDLEVYSGYAANDGVIRIEWTATGDDGTSGTANYCEVRILDCQITDENWDEAELVVVITDPEAAGENEMVYVSGLENGEVIYFAVKVFDDNDNASEVSNSPWGKIVYTIHTGPCNGCGNCIYWCPEDAITDHGSWASIDYTLCSGCGTCDSYCPRNAISRYVINSW